MTKLEKFEEIWNSHSTMFQAASCKPVLMAFFDRGIDYAEQQAREKLDKIKNEATKG